MARRKIKTENNASRKDDLDPSKDQFIDKTTAVLDWAYERRRPIGLLLGVILLGAIGGIVADRMIESSKAETAELLSGGLKAAMAPVLPPPEDVEKQLPEKADDDFLSFETHQARATETIKQFEKAAAEGDSAVGILGQLGKATAHYDLGEYDKASALYEKFLASNHRAAEWLRPSAVEGLALSKEAGGKVDEARKLFDDLIGKSQGTAANMARYHAARLALKKDDKERATELLREVVDTYAEEGKPSRSDYLFVQARERLLELDPEADVPALPAGGMGGLDGIDPRVLQQLMQAQARGGAS